MTDIPIDVIDKALQAAHLRVTPESRKDMQRALKVALREIYPIGPTSQAKSADANQIDTRYEPLVQWAAGVRDDVLYPLAHLTGQVAQAAEGYGAASVGVFKDLGIDPDFLLETQKQT